jgi:hypothetical protein
LKYYNLLNKFADMQEEPAITGGAFSDVKDQTSPFGFQKCEGIDLGAGEPEWIVNRDRAKYDTIFESLNPINSKVTGSAAKKEMVKSRLPNPVLAKVWRLADVDQDGALDSDEFALAMHLINIKLDGYDMPDDLPDHLIPPSKKQGTIYGITPYFFILIFFSPPQLHGCRICFYFLCFILPFSFNEWWKRYNDEREQWGFTILTIK